MYYPIQRQENWGSKRESKQIAEDHAAGKWLRWDWNSGVWLASPCPFHVPEGLYYITYSWSCISESMSGVFPLVCIFLASPVLLWAGARFYEEHRKKVEATALTLKKLTVRLRGWRSSLLPSSQASSIVLPPRPFFFPAWAHPMVFKWL